MDKNYSIYLHDIIDSIDLIESYLTGASYEKFLENEELQDAVIRRLQIIGEAAKRVPTKIRDSHPGIEWREITGTRNRIIHDYADVDLDLVWDITESKLPELKGKISKIIPQ